MADSCERTVVMSEFPNWEFLDITPDLPAAIRMTDISIYFGYSIAAKSVSVEYSGLFEGFMILKNIIDFHGVLY